MEVNARYHLLDAKCSYTKKKVTRQNIKALLIENWEASGRNFTDAVNNKLAKKKDDDESSDDFSTEEEEIMDYI